MPQSTLSFARLNALLPAPVTAEELGELLFPSKAELKGVAGDELRLEVTADRLDLLDEGGLAAYLNGARGAAHGLLPLASFAPGGPPATIEVDPSVVPLRPWVAGVLLDPPDGASLDAGLLEEAVRVQELLHGTFGLDRRLASLGIYPAERFRFPLRYALEPLEAVRFVPLDGTAPTDGAAFFAEHPMAARYGAGGRDADRCLVLRDADRNVLSLPPVLNARPHGEARPGDGRLLLEATGTRAARVQDALGLLALVFVARGWRVAPVGVNRPEGPDDGRSLFAHRTIPLAAAELEEVAGVRLPSSEVEHLFARARLGAHPAGHGWDVRVPPWRSDVLTSRDLVEEVVLARGVRPEEGVLPPSPTRGRRLPAARVRRAIAAALLGQGFVPLCRPVLAPERIVRLLGRPSALAVANPVSEQYGFLRDALQVTLLGSLERNVRSPYPQRLSEVGPVVVADPGSETGGSTRHRAGFVLAAEAAGFAEAAAGLDYLLGTLGVRGVREPADLPGTIPGRAARLRLAGEPVAEVGEIHPRVLDELHLPVPVAWAELDLTGLAPLLAPARPP